MPTGYGEKSKESGIIFDDRGGISDAWSSSESHGGLQIQLFDGRFHSFKIAEWTSAFDAVADRSHFLFGQRLINEFDPAAGARNRP